MSEALKARNRELEAELEARKKAWEGLQSTQCEIPVGEHGGPRGDLAERGSVMKALRNKGWNYCRCGHAESRHYHDQSDSRNGDNSCPVCEKHGLALRRIYNPQSRSSR